MCAHEKLNDLSKVTLDFFLSLLPPLPNFSRMSQRQDDDQPGEYEVNNNNVSV